MEEFDYAIVEGGNENNNLLIGIIIVLVLILLGIFVFGVYGYAQGGNGLYAGAGFGLGIKRPNGRGNSEGYIMWPGYHGKGTENFFGLSKWYPYGSSVGPYRSEGFLPQPKNIPSRTWSGGVWDTSAGQRSTASVGPWSTLMAYGESMYEGDLPQSRWRGWPTKMN